MKDSARTSIDDSIFSIYKKIRSPIFPIHSQDIVKRVHNCRYITYDELARVSNVDYPDIVKACKSLDGCTQYDPATNRYLISINTSPRYGASQARIRWTVAHELGHIIAGHFTKLNSSISSLKWMEEEADYFAASLLAPIPAMLLMRVRKPANIRDWFGLSQTAAEYRWSDLQAQHYDERLMDHFQIFRPRSFTKDSMLSYPKNINIIADDGEPFSL